MQKKYASRQSLTSKTSRTLRAHKVYISYKTRKFRRKMMSGFLLVFAFALLLVPFVYMHFKHFSHGQVDSAIITQDERNFATVSQIVYRHTYAYSAYCLKKGYKMRTYPDAFEQKYASAMLFLNRKTAQNGESLLDVFTKMQQQYGPSFDRIVEKELLKLYQKTGKTGTSFDYICATIDENADMILTHQDDFDHKILVSF